ncbi:hypothetical protein F8388_004773 [Cannabis sativa]|uniref:RING-type domain-containing protein n=1 Tax=Cannabis sativa TaxID=3483 RepID=A0A7J6HP56_CANSA|nr:hypothetical protein F8388_004773 [Cannabis sativa]
MKNINWLPNDLIVDILADVAATSISDFFNAKLSWKLFNKLAKENDEYIHNKLSLDELSCHPWDLYLCKEAIALFMKCLHSQNSEAMYRQGVIDYLNFHQKKESGLELLEKAANTGHLGASYFMVGVTDPIAGSILTTQINNYIDIHINNLPFAAFKYVIVNIYIVTVTSLEQEQQSRIIDSTFREALGVIPNVPATQESINKLKELNIKEGDDIATNNNCTICQENLLFEDMKVVEMPCSHLYHKNCIVSWLKIKHLCPLCRYSIPTATTAVENTVLDANTNSATLS